jgi:hypothetical protein
MKTNEELNLRLSRLVDELHEFGVDAAILLYSWVQDGVTHFNSISLGNDFTIQGMLEHTLNEQQGMELYPLSFSDDDDEGDDWKSMV